MLDEKELGDYIDTHFARAGRLFRQEARDRYDVSSNGRDFDRYVAGEPGPDMARKGPWMDHIRGEVARGLITCRVHIVRGKLTLHQRFEFEWGYVYNAAAGEQIRILDLTEQPRPALLLGEEDFWTIGDERALLMHYDSRDRFLGAEIVPRGDVPRYCAARDAAWEAAVPFADYWNAHPQYWRDRRAA